MPNSLAYIALLAWPFIALVIFASRPVVQAISISVFSSYLFLPSATSFDLPSLPPIDKVSVSNISLLLLTALFASETVRIVPRSKAAIIFLAFLIVGPFVTVVQNSDPLIFGLRDIQGLRLYDAVSTVANATIGVIPFLVGRTFLSSVAGHRLILKMFLIFGLVYSSLMLVEVRLSPQLHTWIYGFFPHSFAQQIRFEGYRPVVFLNHGLTVAFFAMSATVSAAILWRSAAPEKRGPLSVMTCYLGFILFLCKSLGSFLYGVFLIPLVTLFSVRTQLLLASSLAIFAFSYPLLRGSDLVPTTILTDIAAEISEDRAGSLQYRFDNEDSLLKKANERPLFGWGTWGRNRVYDPATGADLSTTDGYWVILIGSFGWVGYIATFGLLAWPILAIWRVQRKIQFERVTTGLCLLLAINMIELLPNATFMPWTWLIAGALLGYAENPVQEKSKPPPVSYTCKEAQRSRAIL